MAVILYQNLPCLKRVSTVFGEIWGSAGQRKRQEALRLQGHADKGRKPQIGVVHYIVNVVIFFPAPSNVL